MRTTSAVRRVAASIAIVSAITFGAGYQIGLGMVSADNITCNGISRCEGTPGKDVMTGNSLGNFLDGIGSDDTLKPKQGNDRGEGGGSADTILGDNGNDYLLGEDGWDTVEGEGGDDIFGTPGNLNPALFGNDGNDVVRGGGGTDYCKGGSGTDTLNGCEMGD